MKTCENCGNEHEGTYGSGRFCSTKCSRGFSTKAKRVEINEKVKNTFSLSRKIKTYKISCIICSKKFEYNRKNTKTCSRECLKQHKANVIRKNKTFMEGGQRQGAGRGKSCWYNSPIAGKVHLDSTWELKYAIYLDDNKINWKRNTARFYYSYENKKHYYVPDFYLIEEDIFIEVKGYAIKKDFYKWSSVQNLKVLYKQDLIELGLNL